MHETTTYGADASQSRTGTGLVFLLLVVAMIVGGVPALWYANRAFAPEMYSRSSPADIGKALGEGRNYALFDLNVNIREIRDAQIARMETTPDVAILGASHWQEAHADLVTHKTMLNAHIHRDYWEDMLAMVEIFERHGKLPRQLIISMRDNLFTPIGQRTDFLWLPGIPYYRAIAARLGLEQQSHWTTLPVQRWREQLSIQMLYANASRWYKAKERPHVTSEAAFEGLDVLLPGGSIVWSKGHMALYTTERTVRTALAFAEQRRKNPPMIDPKGVHAIERLFVHLKEKGVEVFLAHPPFNPLYFDALKDSPYMIGLRKIEELTRDFADRHGFRVIGSFDPRVVGCDASMYVDAEHANPACLARIFRQYEALDRGLNFQSVPSAGARSPEVAAAQPSLPTPAVLRSVLAGLEQSSARPAPAAKAPAPATDAAQPEAAKAEPAKVATRPQVAEPSVAAPQPAAVTAEPAAVPTPTSEAKATADRPSPRALAEQPRRPRARSAKAAPRVKDVEAAPAALVWPGDPVPATRQTASAKGAARTTR
jgi:hypothetical protein